MSSSNMVDFQSSTTKNKSAQYLNQIKRHLAAINRIIDIIIIISFVDDALYFQYFLFAYAGIIILMKD